MDQDFMDAFADSARDFAINRMAKVKLSDRLDSGFDDGVWREIANLGWLSVMVSESDGGLGLSIRELASICQQAGAELLPEPLTPIAAQVAVALSECPQGELRSKLLEQLVQGEALIALAWQERDDEIDVGSIDTRLRTAADGYKLDGQKILVTPAKYANGLLILAQRDDGSPALIWADAQANGITREDHQCVDGSYLSNVMFDGVAIDRAHVLATGPMAREIVNLANDYARIAAAAELVGIMKKAFDITLEYIRVRKQFGKRIGDFQVMKHRAVDLFVQCEIASACLRETLEQITASGDIKALASRVKSRASQASMIVTRLAIQMHGAIGFTDEYSVGWYFKRAMSLSSWLGNAKVHQKRFLDNFVDITPDEQDDVPVPADGNWDDMDEQEFRRMVRGFFRRNYPEQLRNIPRRLGWEEIKEWTDTLSKQGWIAPGWPKQFGGMGLSPDKLIAYVEEYEGHGIARILDMGVVMVGPLLIKHGTPEQQQEFLPKILSAEHRWCQGYSEPGAGSDLASLSTSAVLDGDEFIVNGQKIWTTMAHHATHIFTLVRTDKKAKKQAGISFLLIDLSTPGITIRPITDITGHVEFCEVFFENVRVPSKNLVGALNQGWTMAKALLGFERIFLGSPKQGRNALGQLREFGQQHGNFDDPQFRATYAAMMLDVMDQAAAYSEFAAIVKRGESLPPSVSLLKIWGTETYQRICLYLFECAQGKAPYAMTQQGAFNGDMNPAAILFNAVPATIYGGSSEIQREIVGRQVLGLGD